jgi:hypothetical protein
VPAPVGLVDASITQDPSRATQSETVGQETPTGDSRPRGLRTDHTGLRSPGFVDVRMLPERSTATQSVVEGQLTPLNR